MSSNAVVGFRKNVQNVFTLQKIALKAKGAAMREKAPFNQVWVEQPRTTINRLHILFHGCLFLALYNRIIMILSTSGHGATLALSLLFFAQVLLFFLWILSQPFRSRPVARRAFPERLPDDEELPEIDVFVTADPDKEPVVQVMNSTEISNMAFDYPQEKLSVYLSDDGDSSSTLNALREAFSFASSVLHGFPSVENMALLQDHPKLISWSHQARVPVTVQMLLLSFVKKEKRLRYFVIYFI